MEEQKPFSHPSTHEPELSFEVWDGEVVAVYRGKRTTIGPVGEVEQAMRDYLTQLGVGGGLGGA